MLGHLSTHFPDVPKSTLLVDADDSAGILTWPEGGKGGASVEIKEGQKVRFMCNVRARPPHYNITWLLNVSNHCITSNHK